jgi:hypothetical protein
VDKGAEETFSSPTYSVAVVSPNVDDTDCPGAAVAPFTPRALSLNFSVTAYTATEPVT